MKTNEMGIVNLGRSEEALADIQKIKIKIKICEVMTQDNLIEDSIFIFFFVT